MMSNQARQRRSSHEKQESLPFWIPPGRYGRTGPPFKPAPAGALAHRPAVIPLGLQERWPQGWLPRTVAKHKAPADHCPHHRPTRWNLAVSRAPSASPLLRFRSRQATRQQRFMSAKLHMTRMALLSPTEAWTLCLHIQLPRTWPSIKPRRKCISGTL